MAVRGCREIVRDVIDETSLGAFEDACEAADRLFRIMEKETDPTKAFTMASSWAVSIITLAKLESSLLASVLALYEADLEPSSEKIDELNQRKADAEHAVYDTRGPDHNVAPLSMQSDPARVQQIHRAKMARAQTYEEVRTKMAALSKEREPIQLTIGKIKRTLRALRHFAETRFPEPLLPARNPMKPARVDKSADPIAAWATKYVENMGNRSQVDARAAAVKALRAQPVNRYDRSGQVIVH